MNQTKKLYKYAIMAVCAILMSVSFTSCGDDDDNDFDGDNPSVNQALIGTWESRYYDSDEAEYITSTITFKKNGKCTISESCEKHPQDSYSVTVNYSVHGDITGSARLSMWGKDIEGEYTQLEFIATISGNNLKMTEIEGENVGETMNFTRK